MLLHFEVGGAASCRGGESASAAVRRCPENDNERAGIGRATTAEDGDAFEAAEYLSEAFEIIGSCCRNRLDELTPDLGCCEKMPL
jgi:hypothetical protein